MNNTGLSKPVFRVLASKADPMVAFVRGGWSAISLEAFDTVPQRSSARHGGCMVNGYESRIIRAVSLDSHFSTCVHAFAAVVARCFRLPDAGFFKTPLTRGLSYV